MANAIHIEIDALFFIVLFFIARQSQKNVNQQMRRVLFRRTVYGIIGALLLDIAWLLVEGQTFPGAVALNNVINALFLGLGVLLGCLWYLYVLETLGYRITKRLSRIVMLPGCLFLVLNILSIRTGWIFLIDGENRYVRGPLFWLQTLAAVGMLMISFVHIIVRLIDKKGEASQSEIRKLLGFYIIPVIGTLAAIPFVGMPGTWTCAAVSIILMYMDDQDREIVRDSLTGLNNRKLLESVFREYSRQAAHEKQLYLMMMDLDGFKGINDSLGHPTGDQALINTSKLLMKSVEHTQSMVARYGGDEFLIMGFFENGMQAARYRKELSESFDRFNRENSLPYELGISIGSAMFEPGMSFEELVEKADAELYREKKRRNTVRMSA